MRTIKCVGCDTWYGDCKCDRPFPGAHLNGLPTRILDVLETDGGWLVIDSIADALDAKPDSVKAALRRLGERGLVESRSVPLVASIPRTRPDGEPGFRVNDFGEDGHRAESRIEWRLA